MKVSFENIEQFAVPLSEHKLKWMFEDENHQISPEFSDQIIPLDEQATKFLRDFENSQRIFNSGFFKDYDQCLTAYKSEEEIKKWLYQKGFSFDKKVFWTGEYEGSFILTWKMVIKFVCTISNSDTLLWDETMNWGVFFFHEETIYYGKNRIYNYEDEYERIAEKQREREEFQRIIEEAKLQAPRKKYLKNPYLS